MWSNGGYVVWNKCSSIYYDSVLDRNYGRPSFFTLNSYGVSSAKSALLSILSGGIVPIVLFPERIADFLNYLPFAGMVSVPINIYLGKYAINQALEFIILQVAWGIILGIIALVFYRFSIKKVVVQGG